VVGFGCCESLSRGDKREQVGSKIKSIKSKMMTRSAMSVSIFRVNGHNILYWQRERIGTVNQDSPKIRSFNTLTFQSLVRCDHESSQHSTSSHRPRSVEVVVIIDTTSSSSLTGEPQDLLSHLSLHITVRVCPKIDKMTSRTAKDITR